MRSALQRQMVCDPSLDGPLDSSLGRSWEQVRQQSHRVLWNRSGAMVRGVFLGYDPLDPEMAYGYVYTPSGVIQAFSCAPLSLAEQLAVIPPGALVIIDYLGLGERQRKRFRVEWKRRGAWQSHHAGAL